MYKLLWAPKWNGFTYTCDKHNITSILFFMLAQKISEETGFPETCKDSMCFAASSYLQSLTLFLNSEPAVRHA